MILVARIEQMDEYATVQEPYYLALPWTEETCAYTRHRLDLMQSFAYLIDDFQAMSFEVPWYAQAQVITAGANWKKVDHDGIWKSQGFTVVQDDPGWKLEYRVIGLVLLVQRFSFVFAGHVVHTESDEPDPRTVYRFEMESEVDSEDLAWMRTLLR